MDEKRQKSWDEPASGQEGGGEASEYQPGGTESDTARSTTPSPDERLMEEILEGENLKAAYEVVVRNAGAPGVDGITVDGLKSYLAAHWQRIRREILSETYAPQAVRRVEIPKGGGGVRKLGIPCVIDRFIQQATLQVLQRRWDKTFSENSYGFRPGRSQHQAVKQAQKYVQDGFQYVVDIDLEKFFDKVNHDVLMSRIANRVKDKRLLKLIRSYLNAGVMENGLTRATEEGMPQGSPISPLLSNLLLDELDRELQRRNLHFVRFADDCNIYVKSERAGQRVMDSITRFLAKKLRLKVNKEKSAVGKPSARKFLGFRFLKETDPRICVAPPAIEKAKEKIRKLTRSGKGKSLTRTIEKLAAYLRGWIAYFGLSEAMHDFARLDKWIRRRLRCLVWKHWKHGRNRLRHLRQLDINEVRATKLAGSSKGAWRLSASPALCYALPNSFFTQQGLPSLLQITQARISSRRTAVYGPVRTVV
jgi:RNA-directed DNA polymerase